MYLKVVLSFQMPTKRNSTGDLQIRNKLLSYVRTCHPCFKEVSVTRHPVLFLTNLIETVGGYAYASFLNPDASNHIKNISAESCYILNI